MFRYAKSSRHFYSIWSKSQNSSFAFKLHKSSITRNFAAKDGRAGSGKGEVFRKPSTIPPTNPKKAPRAPPTKVTPEPETPKTEPPKTEAKNPKSENEGVKASTICPIEINIPPPCPEEINPPPPPCPPETKSQSIYEACPVLPHSCPPPQLSPEVPPICPVLTQEDVTKESGCKQVEPPPREICPPFKAPEDTCGKDSQAPPPPPPDNKKWIIGILALALGGTLALLLLKGKDTEKEGASRRRAKKRVRPVRELIKIPATCEELPKQVQYLLIGGGTATSSAFRSIKSLDPKAKVLILTQEPEFPYMRPPLSKELWNSDRKSKDNLVFKQWNGTVRSVFFEPDSFYMEPKQLASSAKGGVAVARGWTVTAIDALKREVTLDDGSSISYDKCLLAPGSKPKAFPIFDQASDDVKSRVFKFRDVFDFRDLAETIQDNDDVVIIGGGYLGSELACALSRQGVNVTQVFREPGLLAKVLPKYLSVWLTTQIQEDGVNVLPENEITGVSSDAKGLTLSLANGKKIEANYVILATGAVANTDLAESSKLETHPVLGGYLVNSEMLARSNLYIAGDAACFYDERFGRRRVEHHDHAVVSGRLAGENMVGAGKPYLHTSMLWSDLSPDIGWEGVGILDPKLQTTGVFAFEANENKAPKEGEEDDGQTAAKAKLPAEQYNKGVVFYLKDDNTVVGILLWNVFNRLQLAKQILRQECKYDDLNELAKLFQIHSD